MTETIGKLARELYPSSHENISPPRTSSNSLSLSLKLKPTARPANVLERYTRNMPASLRTLAAELSNRGRTPLKEEDKDEAKNKKSTAEAESQFFERQLKSVSRGQQLGQAPKSKKNFVKCVLAGNVSASCQGTSDSVVSAAPAEEPLEAKKILSKFAPSSKTESSVRLKSGELGKRKRSPLSPNEKRRQLFSPRAALLHFREKVGKKGLMDGLKRKSTEELTFSVSQRTSKSRKLAPLRVLKRTKTKEEEDVIESTSSPSTIPLIKEEAETEYPVCLEPVRSGSVQPVPAAPSQRKMSSRINLHRLSRNSPGHRTHSHKRTPKGHLRTLARPDLLQQSEYLATNKSVS